MQLDNLLRNINFQEGLQIIVPQGKSINHFMVEGVAIDSRQVEPGFIFVAVPGTNLNGVNFTKDAVQNGAHILICEYDALESLTQKFPALCLIGVGDVRKFAALVAKAFYEHMPETVVAVTGTNGKTSVAEFVRQIWEKIGFPAASLGTLGLVSERVQHAKILTTPDSISLYRLFRNLHDHHVTHIALEASSHGLDQFRLEGVSVLAAGFTNLSHDHLDYHGTMENYLEAKLKLFKDILSPKGTAVLNGDIPEFEIVKEAVGHRDIISYGYKGKDIILEKVEPLTDGQRIVFKVFGISYDIVIRLIGTFQVYNILCAIGMVLACDRSLQEKVMAVLPQIVGVPGRLEFAGRKNNGATIYVDYAHAADGLANVLQSVRVHTGGKVAIVFGAGGGRDPHTRLPMGEAVQQYADYAIITDDNPRFEDPAAIRAELRKGCPKALEIPDRAQAIDRAIADLGPNDILVIAGKGPENGQIVQGITYPFDDIEVAQNCLERHP